MSWWMEGGGYTTDINRAEVFTKDDALKLFMQRNSDIPWPKVYIDSITRPVVDHQDTDREKAIQSMD